MGLKAFVFGLTEPEECDLAAEKSGSCGVRRARYSPVTDLRPCWGFGGGWLGQ